MGLLSNINDLIRGKLREDIDELIKSSDVTENDLPQKPQENQAVNEVLGQKAIIEDPFFYQTGQSTIFKQKASRLTNKTLKDVSLRDWLVSAIIQIRVDTLLRYSRRQERKFDGGYRVVLRDETQELTEEDIKNIAMLERFIENCGRTENVAKEDQMNFGTYIKKIIRDALTFGHISTEKVMTRGGALHHFRPLPAEAMALIDRNSSKQQIENEIKNAEITYKPVGSNNPTTEKQVNEQELSYYKYAQLSYDLRVLRVFGDEDMIWKTFNVQNFADTLGYDYSPLELAILLVTNHINAENYNANFFTQGYAARGVLHLKGTVTQSNLTAFRRQFYNTISGVQNAWKTPIVAGLEDVQWIPISGNARDMEYMNFNSHLMRAICTQFQIDPIELGLDFLTSGTGRTTGAGQEGNAQKVAHSRERGLVPILMFIEDHVNNDIIPCLDKELADRYKFRFEGYTDETPQTEIALLQAEMTVHKSMNDLLKVARKSKIDLKIADLPLNATFWSMVGKHMTKGEIREFFFGDKGAASRKELSYFSDDPLFMQWQSFLMQKDQAEAAQQMQQMAAQGQNDQINKQNAHNIVTTSRPQTEQPIIDPTKLNKPQKLE